VPLRVEVARLGPRRGALLVGEPGSFAGPRKTIRRDGGPAHCDAGRMQELIANSWEGDFYFILLHFI